MEAAPRLPLLQFACKISTKSAEFSACLKQYIQSHYHEDPELYNKEIRELESLRSASCRVQKDFTGCSTLKKYYSQLELLKNRFPQTSMSMLFSWKDIYSGEVDAQHGIQYEQACILHNVGSLHSELGAMDSRETSEGMKVSCTHFQCAAWAFQHLRDDFPQPKGTDMSYDILAFYSSIMLAQAQQCILEKSMLDNRKSTIIAKVSAQVVEYYKQSLKILDAGPKQAEASMIHSIVGPKLYKLWKKYLEFTIVYHCCVTYLYVGNQAEELQKMGERVTYYQAAMDKLNEAAKLAKNLEMEVTEAITFTMDVVGGKLNAASKENEFVYHEKVPALDSLPEIKGASLVKGIPFHPTDTEISGPDIFARLVPMEAHKASSLYSEEKAKLWREADAMISEKDEELAIFSSSLQLEHLKAAEPAHLPQQLMDCCAALSVKPNAIKDLMNAMQKLSGMYHDVESLLKEISTLLEEEDKRENDFQKKIGKRAPNMITVEMKKELVKYEEVHKKASESNVTLHKAMKLHIGNLNILGGPLEVLSKMIPSVTILDAPNDEGVVKELRRLDDKIEEMKSQRAMLKSQLWDNLQADDITKQLVGKEKQTLEQVFLQELKKHDRQVSLINQNLGAQENICRAITDANARYADIRKATYELMQRRQSMIDSLVNSYEAYEDLLAKSQKGLEFYQKLEASASKLLQRAVNVCKVQDEERENLLEQNIKKGKTIPNPSVNKSLASPKSSPAPAAATSTSGPKLKDYLQYMNAASFGMSAGSVGAVPSLPSHFEVRDPGPGSASTQGPGMSQMSRTLPEPRTLAYPSEIRPAPLGSEQVEVPHRRPSLINSGYPATMTQYAPSQSHNSSKPYLPQSSGTAQHIPPMNPPINCSQYNPQPLNNTQYTPQPQNPNTYIPPHSTTGYYNPPAAAQPQQNIYQPDPENPNYIYTTRPGYDSQQTPQYLNHQAPTMTTSSANYQIPAYSGYSGYGHGPYVPEPVDQGQFQQKYTAYDYQTGSGGQIQDQSVTYPHAPSPNMYAYMPAMGQNEPQNQVVYRDQVYGQQVGQSPMQPSYQSTQVLTPIPTATVHSTVPSAVPEVVKREPASNVELLLQLDQIGPIPSEPLKPFIAGHDEHMSNGSTSETTRREHPTAEFKPQVSIEDLMRQKELKAVTDKASVKDVFADKEMLDRFCAEVERFEKQVDGLTKQSLKGSTPLDQKWKEMMDFQDRESRKLSISVARCCLKKNRVPDIMPYDNCRVEISSLKDDYINASYVQDLSKASARYVATQSPLALTFGDFWTMVYEQQSEVIVCLLSDAEMKGDVYYPTEKGQVLSHGPISVHLRTIKPKPWGVERVIFISHQETRISRAILHVQFTAWSSSVVPSNPSLLLQCVGDVHGYYREQRSLRHPIIVHCSIGVGRTGVFCLLSIAIQEVDSGNGLLDLWSTASKMTQMRKYIIQDKEHMKFCFQALLYYAQDLLMRRGILTRRMSFEDKTASSSQKISHTRHPSADFILGSGNLGKLQSGMTNLGIAAKDDAKTNVDVNICKDSDLTQRPSDQVVDEQLPCSQRKILERSGSSMSVSSCTDTEPCVTQGIPSLGRAGEGLRNPASLLGLDAAHFTLEPMPRKPKRITKESFINHGNQLSTGRSDPGDPLSQLDPLWSIKKAE